MDKKGTLVPEGLLRSFGRMASRMNSADQEALDKRLAAYEMPVPAVAKSGKNEPQPIDLEAAFPALKGPLVVEIGIGNGEHVLFHAQHHPDKRHIGAEVYRNGLKHLITQMEEAENPVNNLKIWANDARALLMSLPDKSIAELIVLYPDPWPKVRHHKRRIINPDFCRLAAEKLQDGGVLFAATDIENYAEHMAAVFDKNDDFVEADPNRCVHTAPPNWPTTKYERKARAEGREKSWYFRVQRKER